MSGCLWNCDAWRIRDWSSDCPAYRIALGHALRADRFDELSMIRDKQVPRWCRGGLKLQTTWVRNSLQRVELFYESAGRTEASKFRRAEGSYWGKIGNTTDCKLQCLGFRVAHPHAPTPRRFCRAWTCRSERTPFRLCRGGGMHAWGGEVRARVGASPRQRRRVAAVLEDAMVRSDAGTLPELPMCCADAPPEYACEEDADDFCADADDACEPEIADDFCGPLVVDLRRRHPRSLLSHWLQSFLQPGS